LILDSNHDQTPNRDSKVDIKITKAPTTFALEYANSTITSSQN
jgi:hypothetical protein